MAHCIECTIDITIDDNEYYSIAWWDGGSESILRHIPAYSTTYSTTGPTRRLLFIFLLEMGINHISRLSRNYVNLKNRIQYLASYYKTCAVI